MASPVKIVAKAPGKPQCVASYNFRRRDRRQQNGPNEVPQDAGITAVTHNHEEESSLGSFAEGVGDEIKTLLRGIEGDYNKIFLAKKKRFLRDTNAFQKLGQTRKKQKEQRQKIFHKYSKQFQTVFQALDMDVKKTKEEEEKLAVLLHEHQKLFYQARVAHTRRLKKFVHLYCSFLKGVKDLDKAHEHFLTNENSELRQEMANLENRILEEDKEHDLAFIRTSLQSLLY